MKLPEGSRMENKTYLALGDILGVRVQCQKCGATVVMNLDSFAKTSEQRKPSEHQLSQLFAACPVHCEPDKTWMDPVPSEQLGADKGIWHLMQTLLRMKDDKRYFLSFEIKQPTPAFVFNP